MVTRGPDGRLISSEPLTPAEMTEWRNNRERSRNPGGKTDADIATTQARPGTKVGSKTEVRGGKRVTVETWRLPDGTTEERVAEEPEPVKPGAVIKGGGPNGEDVQAVTGPDGRISYQPISGAPVQAPPPAGGPTASGRLGEAAADLKSYDEWLDQELRKPGTKLTVTQADKLREARRAFWKTAIEEQVGVVNAQTSIRGQELTQRSQTLSDQANRRSNATSIATSAGSQLLPYFDKMGPGGGPLLARALAATRSGNQDMATLAAGPPTPEIPLPPAAAAVLGMPLPGVMAARGNALGLGRVGGAPAPGAAVAPAVRPEPIFRPQPPAAYPGAPSQPPPTAGETGGPSLQPGPVWQPPVAAAAAPPPPAASAPPVAAAGPPSVGGRVLPPPAVAAPPVAAAPRMSPPLVPGEYVMVQRRPPNGGAGDRVRMKRSEWETMAQGLDPATLQEFVVEEDPSLPESPPWVPIPQTPEYPGATPYNPSSAPWPGEAAPLPPGEQSAMPVMPAQAPAFMQARMPAQQSAGPDQGVIDQWIADPDLDNSIMAQALQEAYPGYDVSALLAANRAA